MPPWRESVQSRSPHGEQREQEGGSQLCRLATVATQQPTDAFSPRHPRVVVGGCARRISLTARRRCRSPGGISLFRHSLLMDSTKRSARVPLELSRRRVSRRDRSRASRRECGRCHASFPRTAYRFFAARPLKPGCVGRTCRRSGGGHARRSPNAKALALQSWLCRDPTIADGLRMRSLRCSDRAASTRRCPPLRRPRPPRKPIGSESLPQRHGHVPASAHRCWVPKPDNGTIPAAGPSHGRHRRRRVKAVAR